MRNRENEPDVIRQFYSLRSKGKTSREAARILSLLARPYHEHTRRQRKLAALLKG